MKRLLFPFISLYERLNLRQRWWHRLAIVIFFLGLLVLAALTLIVTLSQLSESLTDYDRKQSLYQAFPQLEPPEDPTTSVEFDYVQMPPPNGFDPAKYQMLHALDCYDAQGNLQVDQGAAFGGVISQCGPTEIPRPKNERINVPKSRLTYVEHAETCQKQVVAEYAKGDVRVYRSKMNACLTPEPKESSAEGLEQFTDVVPIKSVFKQDMETNPGARRVRVPKVGVVAFPVGMQGKEVERVCGLLFNRAASAERHAQAVVIAYALAVLIALFYLPQFGYRLLLYVVFGGNR